MENYIPEKVPIIISRHGGITMEGLLSEFARNDKLLQQPRERIGAFVVRSANHWISEAQKHPTPKKLFDSFWFEGEICILFASSNQGKTILAVQIADSISTGRPISGFQLETSEQPVLYFDFEMSFKQFEARYSEGGSKHYRWSHNLNRCEIHPDATMPVGYSSFEDYLVKSIEQAIEHTGTKVVIVDNLTYLGSDMETSKAAAPLMKQLKALKTKYDLSLLVLAHTPKRDASRPLSQNDVQGSSRLIQFCDSSFGIGASTQASDLKYLKQVKARNVAIEYDADNVIVCQIIKRNSFLQFERVSNAAEFEHLKTTQLVDKAAKKEYESAQVRELTSQGKKQREIAKEMGISLSKVNRHLNTSA
ncbi:AAA family ATPase [Spirosoma harenae]